MNRMHIKTSRAPYGKAAIFAALLLLVSILSGCGTQATPSGRGDSEKLEVIVTIFAPYDFTRQIAGDSASVRMLIPPGAETHSYEPTPSDIQAIESCDVFIYAGGESDAWVTDLLDSLDTADVTVIKLVDCVQTLEEDESVVVGDGEPEEEAETDEHVWTSVKNAKLISEVIAGKLIELDPENAAEYSAHTEAYLAELDELDRLFRDTVSQGKRSTLIFGDRFPFRYFAEDYGLNCYAAFPGCSTATEVSAQTIVALVDRVKDEGVPVVFYGELSNHTLADTIAEETDTRSLLLHSCHNISKEDFDSGATYVDLMRQNAANIGIALG